ncbi:MAG TPA: hypothetical protein VF062_18265 [Candidatus Limnocylindrales bacterium]
MRSIKTILAVAIPSALLVGGGMALIVPNLTGSDPIFKFPGAAGSRDPGLAVCEQLRDAPAQLDQMTTATAVDPAKVQEAFAKVPDVYREIRARFDASKFPDIRDSGVRYADASIKVFSPRDAAATDVLDVIAEQAQAYQDLSDACAQQNIAIPELGVDR